MLGRRDSVRLPGIAFVCAIAGCTEPPKALDAPPAQPASAVPAASEVIPENVATKAPVVPAIEPAEIGFAAAPTVSKKARAANRKALELHRAGDYAGARKGFEAALALSPDHDMARFNLACALARLGEIEASRAELETLLRRDLLRFQGRWKTDADLEAVRTTKHAPELDALIEGLRTAYDAAHDQGIAAYLYDVEPSPAQTTFGGEFLGKGSSSLISGIWLHDARRFVPLGRGGTVAMLDLPNRRLLRAQTSIEELHCNYAVYATAELVSTHPDPSVQPKGEAPDTTEEEPSEDEPDYGPPLSVGLSFDEDYDGPWMNVTSEGGKLHTRAPEGYTLRRRRLTVPGRETPIKLDGDYQDIFVTGGPEAPVFLLGRRFDTDYDEELITIFDATVARVDVGTATIERIAHGEGDAWVVVGPDASVYVEIEGSARRWPTATSSKPEATMPGLHLMMPVDPPECMCCG